jgi:hypothetical protein
MPFEDQGKPTLPLVAGYENSEEGQGKVNAETQSALRFAENA